MEFKRTLEILRALLAKGTAFLMFWLTIPVIYQATTCGASDDIPHVVLEYINQVGKLSSLEYQSEVASLREDVVHAIPSFFPQKGEYVVFLEAAVKRNMLSGDVLLHQKFYIPDMLGPYETKSSIAGDVATNFQLPESPGFVLANDLVPGFGYFGPLRSREEFLGPEYALGFYFGDRMGVANVNLADALAACRKFEIQEDSSIVGIDIFSTVSPLNRYDVVMTFDSHGEVARLLKWELWLVSKVSGEKQFTFGFEIEAFHIDCGINIPQRYNFKVREAPASYNFVDLATIKVNRAYTQDDFRLEIPENVTYFDAFQDKLIQSKVIEKTQTSGIWSYWWLLILTLLVAAVVVVLRRNKIFGVVALVISMGLNVAGGCNGVLPADSRNYAATVVQVPDTPLDVESEVGRAGGFQFNVKNKSDRDTLRFDPVIRSTCGCTNLSFTKVMLDPGEETIVDGTIVQSFFPGTRSFSLLLTLVEPVEDYISVEVNFVNHGDWAVHETGAESIVVDSVAGQPARKLITLGGVPDVISSIKFNGEGLTVVEKDSTSDSERIFLVESLQPVTVGRTTHGSLMFGTEVGTPEKRVIEFVSNGRSPAKWSPPIALLKAGKEKTVRLILEEHAVLLGVSSPSGFTITPDEPGSSAQVRTFSVVAGGHADGFIKANVKCGTAELLIDLPLRIEK